MHILVLPEYVHMQAYPGSPPFHQPDKSISSTSFLSVVSAVKAQITALLLQSSVSHMCQPFRMLVRRFSMSKW